MLDMVASINGTINGIVWASETFFSIISVPAIAIRKNVTIRENAYTISWYVFIGLIIDKPKNSSNGVQNLKNNPTNNNAVTISTIGYWMLMCSLQNAHFPFNKIYDKTGILWNHFSGVWHFGHFDAGNTIDSSLTVLSITTFKKLPIHKPITNMNVNNIIDNNIYPPLFIFV